MNITDTIKIKKPYDTGRSMRLQQAKQTHLSNGFTLIETIVAIFILSLSIGALLTLTTGGIFSVRYARNQIVADNLLQESLEYIHNSRDTALQRGQTWNQWLGSLYVNSVGTVQMPFDLSNPRGCFTTNGCVVDPYVSRPIRECAGSCQPIQFYPDYGFYGYDSFYPFGQASSIITSYVRKITARLTAAGELVVTAEITWKNGSATKTIEQSMILTDWHI